MYILVRVEYDYHRFQENLAVYNTVGEAVQDYPKLVMYERGAKAQGKYDGQGESHLWLQSFDTPFATMQQWWHRGLKLSEQVSLLEKFNEAYINPSRSHLDAKEVEILWHFYNYYTS